MTDYNFGEVLLLRFPYSDGNKEAKRPVVLLAKTDMKDIVVSKVTSVEQKGKYDIAIDDWQKAGLLFPSVIRVDKLATLSKHKIIRNLGILDESYHTLITDKIKQLFNIK